MPCTPISESASRTTSSLNGLMIAVTSFIDLLLKKPRTAVRDSSELVTRLHPWGGADHVAPNTQPCYRPYSVRLWTTLQRGVLRYRQQPVPLTLSSNGTLHRAGQNQKTVCFQGDIEIYAPTSANNGEIGNRCAPVYGVAHIGTHRFCTAKRSVAQDSPLARLTRVRQRDEQGVDCTTLNSDPRLHHEQRL